MSNWVSRDAYLTSEEVHNNARCFYTHMLNDGWSVNAICAMLGNIEAESGINPGKWEDGHSGNKNYGFGLVQWTPASKLFNWIEDAYGVEDYDDGDLQMDRLYYERETSTQYAPTSAYPLSFAEFAYSDEPPAYLAEAFLMNYERPYIPDSATESLYKKLRGANAEYWYKYLTGNDPPPYNKFPYWLLFKFNHRRF